MQAKHCEKELSEPTASPNLLQLSSALINLVGAGRIHASGSVSPMRVRIHPAAPAALGSF